MKTEHNTADTLDFDLPRKQKSEWKHFGSKPWNWRGMPTILGVNFGGESLGWAWSPRETRLKHSREKIAKDKCAGKFLNVVTQQNKRFTPSPLCRTSGSMDWGNFREATLLQNLYRARLECNYLRPGGLPTAQPCLGLRGPAAILFISRDACSDSIANLFRACFKGYRTIIARYVAKWRIAQMCLCETD